MKQRIISTKFWSDDYINNLDPLERYLFLYFLTNEHTNICGIYELPLRIMAFETGIDKEMLLKILNRFSEDRKIYYLNNCWVFIKNFRKHQSVSPDIKTGIARALAELPPEIREEVDKIDTGCIDSGTPPDTDRPTKPNLTKLNLTKLNLTNSNKINHFFNLFQSVNPSFKTLFGNNTQRAALARIIKNFQEKGIEAKLDELISEVLPKINSQKYAPIITTPLELESKMGKLFAFIKQNESKKGKEISGLEKIIFKN